MTKDEKMEWDEYQLGFIRKHYEELKNSPVPKGLAAEYSFTVGYDAPSKYMDFIESMASFQLAMERKDYDTADAMLDSFMYNKTLRADYRCHMMWLNVLKETLESGKAV